MTGSFLECPVCFSLLRNAVETNCGHAFCSDCLSKCRRTANTCPTCRNAITFVHPSFVIRELVAKYGGEGGMERLSLDAAAQVEGDDGVVLSEDPIVVALQFKRWISVCIPTPTGWRFGSTGAFDMEDIFVREAMDEFMSLSDFKDTVDKVNDTIARFTPGVFSTTLAYCCWPLCCCCVVYCLVEHAIGVVELVLREYNAHWTTTGLWWMLMHMDGEDREPGHLDERFFLALRIDPVKARKRRREQVKQEEEAAAASARPPGALQQPAAASGATTTLATRATAGGPSSSGGGGDRAGAGMSHVEVERLRAENELMQTKLWEMGLHLVRSVSGQMTAPMLRPRTPTSSALDSHGTGPVQPQSGTPRSSYMRSPRYVENFPVSPPLSARTLQGILAQDPSSPRVLSSSPTSAEVSVPAALVVNRSRQHQQRFLGSGSARPSEGGASKQLIAPAPESMTSGDRCAPPTSSLPPDDASWHSPSLHPIRVERQGAAMSSSAQDKRDKAPGAPALPFTTSASSAAARKNSQDPSNAGSPSNET